MKNLYFLESTDVMFFSNRVKLSHSSDFAPNLIQINSTLFLLWNDPFNSNLAIEKSTTDINGFTLSPGRGSPGEVFTFEYQSQASFVGVEFLGARFLAWTSKDASQHIYLTGFPRI